MRGRGGRIGNKNVESAEAARRRVDPTRVGGVVLHVHGVADCVDALRPQTGNCRLHVRGRSRTDGDVDAFCGEHVRDPQADALGRTGDDRLAPLQLEIHGFSPVSGSSVS